MINGTTEIVFTPGYGVVWAQFAWVMCLSFIISKTYIIMGFFLNGPVLMHVVYTVTRGVPRKPGYSE